MGIPVYLRYEKRSGDTGIFARIINK